MKYMETVEKSSERCVTPFTGVWIEIYVSIINKITILVTPFTGVWIEIS